MVKTRLSQRTFLLILVLILVAIVIAGCGQNTNQTNADNGKQNQVSPPSDNKQNESIAPPDNNQNNVTPPPENKVIELKAASFLGAEATETKSFLSVIDELNKELGDQIHIKYLGGPDAIPSKQLVEATQNGAIDFIQVALPWLADRYPESVLGALVELAPSEAKKKGIDQFFNDGLAAAGVNIVFLGGSGMVTPNTLYTNFPVNKIKDIKGKLIRTTPLHDIAARALGAKTVSIAPTEIYTALDRGVVDGYFWPTFITDQKYDEVTKYWIKPGFGSGASANFISKATWGKLPQPLREKFEAVVYKAADDYYYNTLTQQIKDEEKKLTDRGIKTVTLPKEYRSMQIEGYKSYAKEKFGDRGKKFFELLQLSE